MDRIELLHHQISLRYLSDHLSLHLPQTRRKRDCLQVLSVHQFYVAFLILLPQRTQKTFRKIHSQTLQTSSRSRPAFRVHFETLLYQLVYQREVLVWKINPVLLV